MTRHYAIIERKIAIGIRKPRRESRLGRDRLGLSLNKQHFSKKGIMKKIAFLSLFFCFFLKASRL